MTTCPEEYICPITKEIMNDPVMGPDGHTYELLAIEEWLRDHGVSPMTRVPMSVDQLVKNHALRNLIERYLTDTTGSPGRAVPTSTAQTQSPAEPPKTEPIKVSIETTITSKRNSSEKDLACITIVPPVTGNRIETVVVAMLDVSGSMGTEASLPKDTTEESQGFSRLDLVKHSMKTIKELLNEKDYLAIITFSDRAEMCMNLTKMDAQGKRDADGSIERLLPDASTNIWDALRLGIETARKPICRDKNVVLLLLTDGEPNINPPRGLAPTLKNTIEGLKEEAERFSIHAFGFGYKLDSVLLNEISSIGRGTYAYIPDCTMVGTVFINFMASTLSTVIPNAVLDVEGVEILKAYGNVSIQKKANGAVIPLGSIQYGQSRTILLEINNSYQPDLTVKLDCIFKGEMEIDPSQPLFKSTRDQKTVDSYAVGILTEALVSIAKQKYSTAFNGKIRGVMQEIEALPSSPFIDALLKDIDSSSENEGQITKAVSSQDWYTRWGRDHLLSFSKSHLLQRCANFKDSSLQEFGGPLFKTIQEEANKIFCSLPPPKPSCDGTSQPVRGHNSPSNQPVSHQRKRAVPAASSMSMYLSIHSGCFDGKGLVTMADGQKKHVQDLRRGDQISSSNGMVAVVQALVETVIPKDQGIEVVEVDGVLLTPWHPVFSNSRNAWVFPVEIGTPVRMQLGSIYNLVLDSSHIVKINNLDVITLGHGKSEGILSHPYFGTAKVIDDLKSHPGWSTGHLVIIDPKTERDAQGLVCKFF